MFRLSRMSVIAGTVVHAAASAVAAEIGAVAGAVTAEAIGVEIGAAVIAEPIVETGEASATAAAKVLITARNGLKVCATGERGSAFSRSKAEDPIARRLVLCEKVGTCVSYTAVSPESLAANERPGLGLGGHGAGPVLAC